MEGPALGPQIAFWLFAAVTLGTALLATFSRKIVHSAFALMASFFGVAGIYAVLGSDFLAVTQVLVYVGGIMILIVFGVLLTDRVPDEYRVAEPRRPLPALLASGLAAAALVGSISATKWGALSGAMPEVSSTVEGIGRSLLTDYLIPFEFASILLLVVLVGSARLARGGAR